jgi:hypothetical protein
MSLSERRLAAGIAELPESEKLLATLLYYERLGQEEAVSQLGLSTEEAAAVAASLHEHLADVVSVPVQEVRALQQRAIERLAAPHRSSLNSRNQFASTRASIVSTVPDSGGCPARRGFSAAVPV